MLRDPRDVPFPPPQRPKRRNTPYRGQRHLENSQRSRGHTPEIHGATIRPAYLYRHLAHPRLIKHPSNHHRQSQIALAEAETPRRTRPLDATRHIQAAIRTWCFAFHQPLPPLTFLDPGSIFHPPAPTPVEHFASVQQPARCRAFPVRWYSRLPLVRSSTRRTLTPTRSLRRP